MSNHNKLNYKTKKCYTCFYVYFVNFDDAGGSRRQKPK